MKAMFRLVLTGAALVAGAPAVAADVTVTLTGVRVGKGDLYLSLQTRDEFLKNQGRYGAIVARPAPGDHQVTVRDVPAGDYAIAVWHDTNGDRKFSADAQGIPTDGWAMVNGKALRAAPQWEQVRFTVPTGNVAATLDMIYPAK